MTAIDLQLPLRLAGLIVAGIGVSHAFLPRALGWSAELGGVSSLTRQVAYVHSAYVGLTCVLLGAVPAFFPSALLVRGPLAPLVLAGLVTFCGSRLVIQLLVYDREHWRGDARRTVIHVGLIAIWTYETAVYAAALLMQLGAVS
jgi:hypothetical protein